MAEESFVLTKYSGVNVRVISHISSWDACHSRLILLCFKRPHFEQAEENIFQKTRLKVKVFYFS